TVGTNAFYFRTSRDAAFPGTVNNTHFGASTAPSSVSYTGSATFVDVRNIRIAGTNVIADLQTSTGATITFVTPTNGATLFVTKPIFRVSAPLLDPATLTVTLNGQLIIGAARGNVATYYDANSGQLTVPLDGTLAGPLTLGDYQLVVTGQDSILATMLSATLNFTVQQKTLSVIGRGRMFSIPATNVGAISTAFLGGLGGAALLVSRWDPTLGTGEYRKTRVSDPLDASNPLQLSNATGAAYDRATLAALPPAGKAYWIYTEQETAFAVSMNMPGNLLPNASQYVVPVYKGFNMIGNPYNFPVAFGSLLVEYGGTVYSISEAAQAHLIDPVLYTYLDPVASGSPHGSYAVWTLPNGTLAPWEGYWIHSQVGTAASPLRLIFQPVSAGRAAEIAGPARTRGSEAAWEMTLKAAGLTGGAAAVTLGVVPGATDGIDAGVDLYAPPAAPGGVSLASAPTRGGGALLRDYRQSAGTLTWQVDVSGPAGSALTITWPDLTRLPARAQAILRDPVTGAERYLRTTASYPLTLGAAETSRRLTVSVVQESAAPALQIQGLRAQRTRAGGALISCALSQPARVTVEIRTATGKLLRRLAAESRAAGAVAITWDGTDAGGRAVPRGTYQCQVSAVTSNGQAAKAMTLLPAR
ncbi:MAG TPA: FlgD immunoglobulin-like domain containing protein, partial [Armatimonadota bacterium]|nr:FlgD immunoglobulin-like domain containing protein [Armatimonadota bacterium]